MPTTVLVVDDHKLMLDGIVSLLQTAPEYAVVGTASNGKDALAALEAHTPDMLLTDVDMPQMSGIELTGIARKRWPELKILVLTMYNEHSIVEKIVQEGANGYILKNTGRNELLDALETIGAGKSFFAQAIVTTMMDNLRNPSNSKGSGKSKKADLTDREQEIVRLIARELTSEQIADQLHISRRTVETHRKNIIRKTGVTNIVGLVRYAYDHGLVD